MQKIIVTGATGMLGLALIAECVEAGMDVTAVINPDSARKSILPVTGQIHHIECDYSRINELKGKLSKGYDTFYNLAWIGTDRKLRINYNVQMMNVEYTLNALKTAKELGCNTFVGAGSQAEYGRYDVPIREDFNVKPDTAYGSAKLEAGIKSREMSKKLGIRHIWTRIFSAYYPNDSKDTMIMYCINKLLNNEKPLLSDCSQIWDYIYCGMPLKLLFHLQKRY